MFINGEWKVTKNKIDVVNPATGEKQYEAYIGERRDVQEAIQAAKDAFPAWSERAAVERADFLLAVCEIMLNEKERLAEVITKEMGKPLTDARGEVQSAIDYFRWYAEEARRIYGETIPASASDKRILVIKQPIGVVGAITPWNFPLSMIARKVAPAFAAGCTIVLKPSSKAPQSAIEMAKIFERAELPKGVFNLVLAESAEVTEEFMNSRDVKKITFTGSTGVGKKLLEASAKTVKRVSMELGGHAPFIVFEDADLDEAADDLLLTKFRCSGQMCTATNRIFVQDSVLAPFTEKLTAKVKSLQVGDGLDPDTAVGPVIDENAMDKIKAQIADAVSKGATVLTGGTALSDGAYARGNFFSPTVLTGVDRDMKIFTEETFGPVAPIISFKTEEELLEMVNHEQYGLASYLYSNDMSRVIRLTEKLEYGMVGVNDPLPFVVQSPFGGLKESGMGKEGGHHGIDGYLEEKMVSIKYRTS